MAISKGLRMSAAKKRKMLPRLRVISNVDCSVVGCDVQGGRENASKHSRKTYTCYRELFLMKTLK